MHSRFIFSSRQTFLINDYIFSLSSLTIQITLNSNRRIILCKNGYVFLAAMSMILKLVILTAELNQELPSRVFLMIGYVLSAELTRHCLSHITSRKRADHRLPYTEKRPKYGAFFCFIFSLSRHNHGFGESEEFSGTPLSPFPAGTILLLSELLPAVLSAETA